MMNGKKADNTHNINIIKKYQRQIIRRTQHEKYIFRGESKKHSSYCYSSLYRKLKEWKKVPSNKYALHETQERIIKVAREHVGKEDDIDVLAKVRHYGGHINLIDFTRNYLVALYFACRGENIKNNGRLIMLPENNKDRLMKYPNDSNQTKYVTYAAKIKDSRLLSQAGVFAHSLGGCIKIKEEQEIKIEKGDKSGILDYLLKFHDISERTLFNDLYGFIEAQKSMEVTHLYHGLYFYDKK